MNKIAVALIAPVFVMLSVLSQAGSVAAQTRCTLTEATAPSVRGLKLGMSAQQLLDLFPGITKKKELKEAHEKAKSATSSDQVILGFDPVTDGDPKQFAGVESVSAGIYKSRVMLFTVQYGGSTWTAVDEWIAKLSEAFKLPAAQEWTVGPSETPNKVLRCDGVAVEASIQGGSASIKIWNTTVQREIDDRAKAADAMRRQEVKP